MWTRSLYAAMLAVSFCAPAYGVEPAKLTILDCQNILTGLNSLDGRNELTKDGTSVVVPYQFGSAKLRLVIQQNISALTTVMGEFSKVQQGIFKEIAGDALRIEPTTNEFARYNRDVSEAQKLPCNAALTRINAADLKLDKNEIPGSVLAALDKILDK